MKFIHHSFFFLLLAAVLSGSCKKTEKSEFTDMPVIQAYLEPGDYMNVQVSRQLPFSSNVQYSSDDINNLSVSATYNNIAHTLTPLGNGKYIDSSLKIVAGAKYDLNFSFNSKNVSAYTTVPGKPQNYTQSTTQIYLQKITGTTTGTPFGVTTDPVTLSWSNPDASYYLMVIENIETSPEVIRDFGTNAPPPNIFRKSPIIGAGLQIRTREFQYFGTHRLILFHVLPDYATLYNTNSANSQNLTNPSTSITNGYGIFTGLDSDTLYLEVTKL